MVIYEIRSWILFSIFATVVGNINRSSWDVAVEIGKEIDFFSTNANITKRVKIHNAVSPTAMAYDDETKTIFLGGTLNQNTSIFYTNSDGRHNKTWDTLSDSSSRNLSHIAGMIWDQTSESLIYIDSINRSIRKIEKTSSQSSIILKLPNHTLRSLAFDTCTRKIYWANSNKPNRSISVCDFNGDNEKVVIKLNLYEPLAVTIDQSEGKLYWIDDEEGIHYKIERSDLDGGNRQVLVQGRHQVPVSIAVDMEYVYWIDWGYSVIWRIRKKVQVGELPQKWIPFGDQDNVIKPTSLITRNNIRSLHCLDRKELKNTETILTNKLDQGERLEISTVNYHEITEKPRICLNGGYLEMNETCLCKNGFEGLYCEKSICHNFCLHGECEITANGRPHCKCSSNFRGQRCEENACSGFCLNDGNCSMKDGEPYCTCQKSSGKRCEEQIKLVDICRIVCSSGVIQFQDVDTSVCSCPTNKETETLVRTDNNEWNKTLIVTLSTTIGVLLVLIVILSIFINKLRRRPRIKKRFIVSKNGITPLTTRPQLPSDQCEIMIENCCNMNICETPCFEPGLRNPELRSSKKEYKSSLLANMEDNESC